ncbi:MAG TPA: hypothetical protein DF383_11060 [Deltaproteobacteria bacterium]|nr:hypothetical protein [Deltaproteobacteria bacterium]
MNILRRSAIIFTAVFIPLFMASKGHAATDNKVAEQAAGTWLTLIDAEKYPEAWKDYSSSFKEKMTQAQWEGQIKSARGILGKLIDRKLKNSTAAQSLPGVPDGNYVVVQYDTNFEKKKSALETVTVILEKDGKWAVAGYYIK